MRPTNSPCFGALNITLARGTGRVQGPWCRLEITPEQPGQVFVDNRPVNLDFSFRAPQGEKPEWSEQSRERLIPLEQMTASGNRADLPVLRQRLKELLEFLQPRLTNSEIQSDAGIPFPTRQLLESHYSLLLETALTGKEEQGTPAGFRLMIRHLLQIAG